MLVALFVNGMWLRHYFNLKHQGIKKPQVLVTGLIAFFAIMLVIAPWQTLSANHETDAVSVSDGQALAIIEARCTSCHATNPSSEMFTTAPAGFVLETLQQAKATQAKVMQRAVIAKDMPLGNITQMTDVERDQLGQWLSSH